MTKMEHYYVDCELNVCFYLKDLNVNDGEKFVSFNQYENLLLISQSLSLEVMILQSKVI